MELPPSVAGLGPTLRLGLLRGVGKPAVSGLSALAPEGVVPLMGSGGGLPGIVYDRGASGIFRPLRSAHALSVAADRRSRARRASPDYVGRVFPQRLGTRDAETP